jgi:AcrR family transcriptional regulator
MSTAYEETGRSQQKRRTRAVLVAAARELMAAGGRLTVEEAAAAAGVSRTTAYRYFPSQRALLLAAHPEVDQRSMLPATPPEAAAARLDAVVQAFTGMVLDTEAQQRTMLRLSLEEEPRDRGELPLRQGRAIGWIAEALESHVDLSADELRSLVAAIRATTGIEALVWLQDVAGLSRRDAQALVRWSAQALLEAATTRRPPIPGGRTTRR